MRRGRSRIAGGAFCQGDVVLRWHVAVEMQIEEVDRSQTYPTTNGKTRWKAMMG